MILGKSDPGECSPNINRSGGGCHSGVVSPVQADAAGVAATELNLSAPFKSLSKDLSDGAVHGRDLGKTLGRPCFPSSEGSFSE